MDFPLAKVYTGKKAERCPRASMTFTGFNCIFIGFIIVVKLEVCFTYAITEQIILFINLITS